MRRGMSTTGTTRSASGLARRPASATSRTTRTATTRRQPRKVGRVTKSTTRRSGRKVGRYY